MRVGFVGLGKLGFPVAMAYATKHDVVGYDAAPHAKEILASRKYPHREIGAQEFLNATSLRVADTVDAVVSHADLIHLAVQTPHQPEFEGITRMPEHRADFDYSALVSAMRAVADSAKAQRKHVTVVVISTVLPGTSERELMPLLVGNDFVSFVYSPQFIAMGNTISDVFSPEFMLLGVDKSDARGVEEVRAFFESFHAKEKLRFMSVASAELTKVAYNVALSVKITIANSLMEICHKTGADVDEVTNALGKATDRVISPKYLRGGMADAGPCHPRDIIALAWLAQKLDLTYDFFGSMARSREAQTEFIAQLCIEAADQATFPIVILGKSYKRGTNLTIGSAAVLLKNILCETVSPERIEQWDPHVDVPRAFDKPAVFVVATDHDDFYASSFSFPAGSVVLDPWGKMPNREGVKVVRVGRQAK